MIYSVSQIGEMVDFLKAFPFVSMEVYKWGISSPMIRLMTFDNTHLRHLSKKQAEMAGAKEITLKNDLGIPIIGGDK